ncbi:L-serine ammonia-lyase [Brackiella oedipodis]|uniref:L-serine ammonia-lyase n=1 Tax=Brackiella oedipodis TaxID=124225 RepID=UPI00048EE561|nr:L-serine ammonia-lyase [Brackiella oedipodis]
MPLSIFDVFKIGVGPSSSHTVGPMIAAVRFVKELQQAQLLTQVQRVKVQLFGSLGSTGIGHGSDTAVITGLYGHMPDKIEPDLIPQLVKQTRETMSVNLLQAHKIDFDENTDLILNAFDSLPEHPNGMRCEAFDENGNVLLQREYFSIGGGFVVDKDELNADEPEATIEVPYAFKSSRNLLELCRKNSLTIAQLMMKNELAMRSEQEIIDGVMRIWNTMQACVDRGLQTEGVLPGGFNVKRRAPTLYKFLQKNDVNHNEAFYMMDWVNLFAISVNEENASGGRIVTAPTNGAAGVIPAVLHFYTKFHDIEDSQQKVLEFLLTAAAIGILYKENASISGAEVGCQGEVGVACSMAAAALTAVQGGSIEQVENAAEIGMEHNLGMTCDPIGGLVQVPCIERNAMGAVKAINASHMALRGDGEHVISLDKVIATMLQTGRDMMSIYKETSQGGLAVNITEC